MLFSVGDQRPCNKDMKGPIVLHFLVLNTLVYCAPFKTERSRDSLW